MFARFKIDIPVMIIGGIMLITSTLMVSLGIARERQDVWIAGILLGLFSLPIFLFGVVIFCYLRHPSNRARWNEGWEMGRPAGMGAIYQQIVPYPTQSILQESQPYANYPPQTDGEIRSEKSGLRGLSPEQDQQSGYDEERVKSPMSSSYSEKGAYGGEKQRFKSPGSSQLSQQGAYGREAQNVKSPGSSFYSPDEHAVNNGLRSAQASSGGFI